MKQQIFKFKKGQAVPQWVLPALGHDGFPYSGVGSIKFGSNGKLFLMPDGCVVSYPSRERDKRASFIKVLNAVGVKLYTNMIAHSNSCSGARKHKGIKNSVKAKSLPIFDPRY